MKTLLFGFLVLAGATSAKASEIRGAPARFDGKAVAVKGKVALLKRKTSRAGRGCFTFDLVDAKEETSVHGGDKLETPPKDGDEVAVTGRFQAKRPAGEHTFENEIDASSKLDKALGAKVEKTAK